MFVYNVTRYDPETREGGLFAGYIETFMKLKVDASGYLAWVRNPDDEERYIESFWMSEGIRLDREPIRPNAAKRGLAKLCFNSMWGNRPKGMIERVSKLLHSPHKLYSFLATPVVEVMTLVYASDDVV